MYSSNNLFSILSRLSSTLSSSLSSSTRRFPEILTHDELVIRSYSAVAHSTSLEQSTSSIVTHLDKWIKEGNKIDSTEHRRIIRDLRDRGRYSIALQVSEWVYKNGLCKFSSSDHAVQLDLIGKVRGASAAAESYFCNMNEEQRKGDTKYALRDCLVREYVKDKSRLSHSHTREEMGYASTVLNYNDIMCLYVNLGQYKKVHDLLAEMKENGVSPDNFSYRTCISSYGMRSDINGMENLLEEMESQNFIEMDWKTYSLVAKYYLKAGLTDKAVVALKRLEDKVYKKQILGYNYLNSLYSSIGSKTELLRFWDLQKAACIRCCLMDYMAMVDALVKLGGLEEAKSLVEEWESSAQWFDYRVRNVLLIGLYEKGLFEEAEALLLDLYKRYKRRVRNSWAIVVLGYISKKEMVKAVKCMRAALDAYFDTNNFEGHLERLCIVRNWLVDVWADAVCKVEDAETLVGSLNIEVPTDKKMYHALLQEFRKWKRSGGVSKNSKWDRDSPRYTG